MTEASQPKKKIYQLAKDINISHETLIEYLRKKGHTIKSHMTVVDDYMLHDILSHFKKDKEVAEKHLKKIQTLKETKKRIETKTTVEPEKTKPKLIRKIKSAEPARDVPPAESIAEKEIVLEETDIKLQKPLSTAEAGVPSETAEEIEQVPPEVKSVEKKKIIKEPSAQPIVPEISEIKTDDKAEKGKKEVKKGPPEPEVLPRRTPKMGLKIKGKIDLEEIKRATAIIEGTVLKGPEAPPSGEGVSEGVELKKRKKKRKRVRSESLTVEETDELLHKTKKKKKLRHREVDQEQVKQAIKRTFANMDDLGSIVQRAQFKKKRKEKRLEEEKRQLEAQEKEKSILRVTEFVSVNELANLMGVNVADVIKKCIELGLMVSINQRLEKDTITLVADEFGFDVIFFSEITEDIIVDKPDDESQLKSRSPVVTIMGHVDHGKTSLLDYIRQSNIVAGEAGGITQHIGAYSVSVDQNRSITFLDTPGHEAFTAMRARGAQLTDIVVLVVAADDNVMPQTVEAISHAQAANVPIVIAINKCDKPSANPDRIKQQLSEKNVLIEEWGGKYQYVEISSKTGKNVDLLLEKILLEADVLDLKANSNRPARGVIIEARVDKGKGVVATILVQKGMLKIGDSFLAGIQSGKVRAMMDERGNRIEIAKPSTPVQILGFDGIPQAGDVFIVVENERVAREISLQKQHLKREQDFRLIRSLTLDDISKKIQEGQMKELKVIVKGDVDGSIGALADSLMKIAHEEVRVNVIHRAVGAISESDVLLATASNAVIIGFNVRPNINARRLAEKENVDIRIYNIIYDAINDIRKALEGLLAPMEKEEITATVEVRETFKVPKIGMIAGCYVQDGKINRSNRVRVIRDGIQIFEGNVASLRRFKDDVREVDTGFECGIGLENFNDLKVGDTIEAFKIVETVRKLT